MLHAYAYRSVALPIACYLLSSKYALQNTKHMFVCDYVHVFLHTYIQTSTSTCIHIPTYVHAHCQVNCRQSIPTGLSVSSFLALISAVYTEVNT